MEENGFKTNTKQCRQFKRDGYCKRGDNCKFDHTNGHNTKKEYNIKDNICKAFNFGFGACDNPDCLLIHINKTKPKYKTCRHWLKGDCKLGDDCNFLHNHKHDYDDSWNYSEF